VRIFEDEGIVHVSGGVNPIDDIETINLELILADAQTVSKRLANIEKDVKRGDKAAVEEKTLLDGIEKTLLDGKFAASIAVRKQEALVLKKLSLLTAKPILYVLNKKAGARNLDETGNERFKKLTDFFNTIGAKWVVVDAGIEHELSGIGKDEREMFRKELGTREGSDGIGELIRASYDLLGLITYFTTGPDETRGWTIKHGSTAPIAGMAIHTDFRDKFIRAEVIACAELLAAGSIVSVREKGLLRTEGKEYIVKDGDVIEFKI